MCADCGAQVWWHRSRNDRAMPPMERSSELVMVLVDGVIHSEHAWLMHWCSPHDQEIHRRRTEAQLRMLEQAMRTAAMDPGLLQEHSTAVSAYAAAVYAEALRHGCPACSAEVGWGCVNLAAAKQGLRIPKNTPHGARLDLVPVDDLPYWSSYTTFEQPRKDWP